MEVAKTSFGETGFFQTVFFQSESVTYQPTDWHSWVTLHRLVDKTRPVLLNADFHPYVHISFVYVCISRFTFAGSGDRDRHAALHKRKLTGSRICQRQNPRPWSLQVEIQQWKPLFNLCPFSGSKSGSSELWRIRSRVRFGETFVFVRICIVSAECTANGSCFSREGVI